MANNGWICLSRKLLTWQWRDDPNMVALWIHLLLRASYETTKYHGITTKRGQLAMSLSNLATATGMTKTQVRTCLKRLTDEGSITFAGVKRTVTVITVQNYEQYQLPTEAQSATQSIAQPNNSETINYIENGNINNTPATQMTTLKQHSGQHRNNTAGNTDNSTETEIVTDCATEVCECINKTDNIKTTQRTTLKQHSGRHRNNTDDSTLYNKYIDISSSSLGACDACAQEGGDPGGAPPGPPEEPPVAAGGGIAPADVGAAAEAIMANAAYVPLVLLRAKMTAEEVVRSLPEFTAQARARGRTYATERELAEHLANWMSKKKQFENERHSSDARRGDNGPGGGVDARAEAERDRHSDALQAAYRLMARSRRGD